MSYEVPVKEKIIKEKMYPILIFNRGIIKNNEVITKNFKVKIDKADEFISSLGFNIYKAWGHSLIEYAIYNNRKLTIYYKEEEKLEKFMKEIEVDEIYFKSFREDMLKNIRDNYKEKELITIEDYKDATLELMKKDKKYEKIYIILDIIKPQYKRGNYYYNYILPPNFNYDLKLKDIILMYGMDEILTGIDIPDNDKTKKLKDKKKEIIKGGNPKDLKEYYKINKNLYSISQQTF